MGGKGQINVGYSTPTLEVDNWEDCADCGATGFTGSLVTYFEKHPAAQAPSIEVVANAYGAVTCPACSLNFSLRDQAHWTGLRHKTCGQKLNVTLPEEQAKT